MGMGVCYLIIALSVESTSRREDPLDSLTTNKTTVPSHAKLSDTEL